MRDFEQIDEPSWDDVRDRDFKIRTLQLRMALLEDTLQRKEACPECKKHQTRVIL